ncbi:MAG: hypothetical protein WC444_05630 [Candidatus Paceibacterota bacterium]
MKRFYKAIINGVISVFLTTVLITFLVSTMIGAATLVSYVPRDYILHVIVFVALGWFFCITGYNMTKEPPIKQNTYKDLKYTEEEGFTSRK